MATSSSSSSNAITSGGIVSPAPSGSSPKRLLSATSFASSSSSSSHLHRPGSASDHVRPILKRTNTTPEMAARLAALRAGGRLVSFDERAIEEHERERIEHPKQKIDEPPTPYNHAVVIHEGSSDESEGEEKGRGGRGRSERPGQEVLVGGDNKDVHARLVLVGSSLEEACKKMKLGHEDDVSRGKGKEPVGISPSHGNRAEAGGDTPPKTTANFKHMRSAVYADEGKRFKELLKKAQMDDEDEEDEEGNEGK